eukprot:3034085-Karenia_brevis.AAC.1
MAIREFVIGWPQAFDSDPVDFLTKLGLGQDHAAAAAQDIQATGGLLESLGIEPHVVELIRSLHTDTWYKYSDLETVIVASKGGRQG